MITGFIIWTAIALMMVGFGVYALISKTAVNFFAGVKVPEIKRVKEYNRAVAVLWFVYAAIYEALGVPLLFLKQNSAGFIITILGVVAVTLAQVIVYYFVMVKYSK